MEPGLRCCPSVLDAPSTGERSGVLSWLTGVGTATMWKRASSSLTGSAVNSTADAATASFPTSLVGSIPCLYCPILASLRSYPTTFTCLANSTAMGMPT